MQSATQLSARISVVIPVKNGARYIGEAIRSCLDEGALVHEVIVVDDASTDGTRDAVLGLGAPRVRIVANRTTGLPAGRNTGAALCSGDWLYFLDADDRVRPGALVKLLDGAERTGADVIYGDYERIDEQGRRLGWRRPMSGLSKPTGDVLQRALRGNFMAVGAQIVRRSAFERAGGFDERLRCLEDWHFWCRVASFATFLHLPSLHVMDYRIHAQSMMHAKTRPFSDYVPAIEAVFTDPLITARTSAAQLAALRPLAETHLMIYQATEAIRLRKYVAAMRSAAEAIGHAPSQTPKVVARVVGTFAGL